MNPNEESYLAKYRSLADMKNRITAMIGELRSICGSLQDWPKTAADLSSPGSMHPEWSDDKLADLVALRANLVVYHQRMEEIRRAWSQLTEKEKSGFAAPGTLVPAAD